MKKKILLNLLGVCLAGSVFGQGLVALENAANSSIDPNVSILGGPFATPYAAPGTDQVALLWYNGTAFQQIGAVYRSGSQGADGPGYFYGETVTVPVYQSTGTFIVQGWTGHFADYAAAAAGGGGHWSDIVVHIG